MIQGILGYSNSTYPESTIGRIDNKYNLGLSLIRQITIFVPMVANIDFGWERNYSNIDLASYSKNTAVLRFTYAIH